MKVLKYFFPPKPKKNLKSGDGALLEIKFEVFLQIFVHFGNKKLGERKKKEKKTMKKTSRGTTITAPPGR